MQRLAKLIVKSFFMSGAFYDLAGIDALKDLGIEDVEVDIAESATAASEGVHLAAWKYKESERLKYPKNIAPITTLPDQPNNTNGMH